VVAGRARWDARVTKERRGGAAAAAGGRCRTAAVACTQGDGRRPRTRCAEQGPGGCERAGLGFSGRRAAGTQGKCPFRARRGPCKAAPPALKTSVEASAAC
jgi:hypothetical protein